MYKILKKEKLNKDVDLMVIEAPLIARNTKPGNFLIVRTNQDSERIPLTIVESDEKSVTIIYQKIGYSTMELGKKDVNEHLQDVVGPLGKAKEIEHREKIIGVAGGVGAAPLYPQLKAYAENGSQVDLVIGAKNRFALTFEDPKAFDHTNLAEQKYLERSFEIATQLNFVFKSISNQ